MVKKKTTPIDGPATASRRVRIKLDKPGVGPLYLQVQSHIRQKIKSGSWPRDYRLPTVRQMSADLKIAYATIARAIRELVREGVLEAHSGRGIFVAHKRKKRLQTIGILGFFSYQNLLQTTRYYRRLLMLLQEKIIERGQTVVYSHWRQNMPLDDMFDGLKMIDGLLIFGAEQEKQLEIKKLMARGLPLICLGDMIRRGDDIPAIHSANEEDSRRAVKILQGMGHRHIACMISGTQIPHAGVAARLAGYRKAMELSTMGYDPKYNIHGDAGTLAAQLLAMHPLPTAIFIASGIEHFPLLRDSLLGTPLELGTKLFPCAYDENLWDTIAPLGISYISIEHPLAQIANQSVDNLLHALEDDTFHPSYTELSAMIVKVNEDGSRRGL